MCLMHACVAQYVNLDDCWMEARDNLTGHILPFADKFPSGMKALGDYIHSLGLKFGVYSGAGDKTCEDGPGSAGYEEQDARDYAAWGVDYVKYDFCNMEGVTEPPRHCALLPGCLLVPTLQPLLVHPRCSPRAALVPEACARSTRRRLRADARRAQRERPADALLDRLVGQGRAAPLARAG